MEKLILYGRDMSPPVRAVKLTLAALNIDYEYKIINTMTGDHLTPEFLQMNPQHTIPTINDDGFILWESNAIITYLVSKYGQDDDDSLYPKDIYKRGKIDQRLNYFNGVLVPRMVAVVRPIFRGEATEFDETAVQAFLESFDLLELFLKDEPFIASSNLSVADFSFSAILETVSRVIPIDEEKFPKLKAWLERMSTLPYYEEINVKPIQAVKQILEAKLAENRKEKGL